MNKSDNFDDHDPDDSEEEELWDDSDDLDDVDDSGSDKLGPEIRSKSRKNPVQSSMSIRGAKRIWFSPRKSGRPSKNISEKLDEAKRVLEAAGEPLKRIMVRKSKSDEPKKPRGRPKKLITAIKEKKPRGRPRKNPVVSDRPKRPRGRPRKHQETTQKSLRPRGRPRKNPDIEDKNT